MIISERPDSCPVCRSSHAPTLDLESNRARWAPPVYDERSKIMFWPTRKVATSSVTSWLTAAGWEKLDPREIPDGLPIFETFVIVREPVERYISALWWIWALGYCGAGSWFKTVRGVADYMAIDGAVWTCHNDEHFTGQWRTLERAGEGARWFRFDDLQKIPSWLGARGAARGLSDSIPHLLSGPPVAERELALDRLDPEIIRSHYQGDVLAWDMACS